MIRVHFMQSQSGCICFWGYLQPAPCSLTHQCSKWLWLETVHCLLPRIKLCYWSPQHVYCLYTTEEAHLVMPSLPVSICAHQRELASKIKTESKTLLYDSIISIVPNRMSPRAEGCVEIAYVCGKDNLVLAGDKWLIMLCIVFRREVGELFAKKKKRDLC